MRLPILVLSLVPLSLGAACSDARGSSAAPSSTRSYFFGNNFYGQLGFSENNTVEPKFTAITSQTTEQNTKCRGGFMHTAALVSNVGGVDTVYLAGDGTSGQLGFGPANIGPQRDFFRPVATLPWLAPAAIEEQLANKKVLDVCTGWTHTCILVGEKGAVSNPPLQKVMCAGLNNAYQLGVGNTVMSSRYLPILGAARSSTEERTDTEFNQTNFRSIHCGADHTLAVTADGKTLYGWGSNALGQLGFGSEVSRPFPRVVLPAPAGDTIESVATGFAFSIVVMTSGSVWVMGSNAEGQLGVGTTQAKYTTPYQVTTGLLFELGPSIRLIAAGGHHVIMIAGGQKTSINGRLHAMGEGTLGQLGLPTPAGKEGQRWYMNVPTPIPTLADVNVNKIAAGMKHSVVLDNCGEVWTFGSDAFGQLGLGGSTAQQNFRRMVPTPIPKRSQWKLNVYDICAGGFHTGLITNAV